MAKGVRETRRGYQIRVRVNGKDYTKSIQCPHSKANLRRAEKLRAEMIRDAGYGRGSIPSFGELAQKWMDVNQVESTTRNEYRKILEKHWLPVLTSMPIDRVAYLDIQQVISSLKVTNKTRRNILHPVSGMFKLAMAQRWIYDNPTDHIMIGKHQKPQVERFTQHEKKRILESLTDQPYLFFLAFFETGMRTGELLGLNWEDFNGEQLRVSRQVTRREIKDLKNKKERVVAVTGDLLPVLRNHPARFAGGAVFLNQNGERLTNTKSLYRVWYHTLSKLSLSSRKPYACRHTRASDLLMAGVEIGLAAKQLGHSVQMFLNIYSDWIDDSRTQVELEKLDKNWIRESGAMPK